jgi:hypothetical protein
MPKKVFTGQMFGKRPVGKPRKKCIDSVEEDSITLLRRRNWKGLEDDRVQWRAKIKEAKARLGLQSHWPRWWGGGESTVVAPVSFFVFLGSEKALSRIERSKVLEILKTTTFWDITTCSFVEVDRRFRGAYYLRHQDDGPTWWWRQCTSLKRQPTSTSQHGAVSKKAAIFILADVRTWNLIWEIFSLKIFQNTHREKYRVCMCLIRMKRKCDK